MLFLAVVWLFISSSVEGSFVSFLVVALLSKFTFSKENLLN